MLAISRASCTARARGARVVYVVVDGDDEVAGFFRISNRRASRPRAAVLREGMRGALLETGIDRIA
jgi:hypothetical protein